MAENIATGLSNDTVKALAETAKDWAQAHGICIRLKDMKTTSDVVQIAPFTLVPSTVSRVLLEQAYDLQKDMSLLYHRISFDYEFIRKSLVSVVENDDFTKRLLEIYAKVRASGAPVQPTLTIQRADYMFHENNGDLSLKQVEVNNIASSFASLDSGVTNLHAEVLRQLGHSDIKKRIPENRALISVAQGLVAAWQHYNVVKSAVLFVVEEQNQNAIDIRLIEYEMLKQTDGQVYVLYLNLLQCFNQLYIDENNKLLTKDLKVEIGVIYFRVGYIPQQLPTESHWQARLMLEQSAAIKCPWIGAHLAGCKKIQQVLSDPKVIEKYIDDAAARKRITDTFVGLYGLEQNSNETDKIVALACESPEKFVLKPQLEGGGNNFYGEHVKEKLLSMGPKEREAYILMERINPIEHANYLVRPNQQLALAEVVSELGIFGILLGDADEAFINLSGGHLLRTKPNRIDEGGVMSGASVLDSPYLV